MKKTIALTNINEGMNLFDGEYYYAIVREFPVKDHHPGGNYYLRMAEKEEGALEAAACEFPSFPIFSKGMLRFNLRQGGRIDHVCEGGGVDFLVAEALVQSGLQALNQYNRKVVTRRQPTNMLYMDRFVVNRLEQSPEGLAEVLIDLERPSAVSIVLPGWQQDSFKVMHAVRGVIPDEMAVMNYGQIFGMHSTFFNEGDDWYILPNAQDNSNLKYLRQRFSLGFDVIASNTISRCKPYSFSESDKIGLGGRYFYDGSIRSMFATLLENGAMKDSAIKIY